MLERVERVTTDVIVAERLKTWIIDNQLQPGDRLPTEQQLCGELGVARHTLREGIKRLAQLGKDMTDASNLVPSALSAGTYDTDIINQIYIDPSQVVTDRITHIQNICQISNDFRCPLQTIFKIIIILLVQ